MVKIRDAQMAVLEEAVLSRYAAALLDKLFVCPDRVVTARTETQRRVFTAIQRAKLLGFVREQEMTPFVIMSASLGERFEQSPLAGWMASIVEATDYPAEERMDAIFALLPRADQAFYFGS